MPYIRGYEEDGFLKQLDVPRQELEILASDKVLGIKLPLWHSDRVYAM